LLQRRLIEVTISSRSLNLLNPAALDGPASVTRGIDGAAAWLLKVNKTSEAIVSATPGKRLRSKA
jgi:hypothetical protein